MPFLPAPTPTSLSSSIIIIDTPLPCKTDSSNPRPHSPLPLPLLRPLSALAQRATRTGLGADVEGDGGEFGRGGVGRGVDWET